MFTFFLIVFNWIHVNAQQKEYKSPDGQITLTTQTGQYFYYKVSYKTMPVINSSPLGIQLKSGIELGKNPVIIAVKEKDVQNEIKTVWGIRAKIRDEYKEVVFHCKGDYQIVFRIYNDAVAYRFKTNFKGVQYVMNELVQYRFPDYYDGWLNDGKTSETNYSFKSIFDRSPDNEVIIPLLIDYKGKFKVALLESDVINYPVLKFAKSKDYEINYVGKFEKYPLEVEWGGYNNYTKTVIKTADYIAKVDSSFDFPWRAMIISDDEKTFADNDLVYKLASPLKLKETDWIKPGKVCWDWWHDYVIEGVDFVTGINTKTYLKHLEFAAKYGLEYIIVDWKWTDKYDLSLVNPDVDIQRIINRGKELKLGVILWVPAYTLHDQLNEALDRMSEWGAAGIKVDFFDRLDQKSVSMYETIAVAAAKRKMLVDFHGCAMPTGLQRAYPNVINFEAVLGNENNKWSKSVTIDHKVLLPFNRMLAGPMDFTPGGMRNEHPGTFFAKGTLPFVQGTRAAEMALYVVYYEPLKMLCDATSEYEKEPDVTSFLASVPVVWDETKVISAEIGKFVVIARRKGAEWFVGVLNGQGARDYQLNLSFLDKNASYQATIFKDGVNVEKVATDYNKRIVRCNSLNNINLKVASGGGSIIKIVNVK